MAVFLWRLETYQVQASKPLLADIKQNPAASGSEAKVIVKVEVHPLGHPLLLFNTHRFQSNKNKPITSQVDTITQIDYTPNPIPLARINRNSPMVSPEKYISVMVYDETDTTLQSLKQSGVGLQLHLPKSTFDDYLWEFIGGADLCAWEEGVRPKLRNKEIIVDPVIGRIVIGVNTMDEANALADHLLITYTYGAVGPVGSHPINRPDISDKLNDEEIIKKIVNYHINSEGTSHVFKHLKDALANIQNSTSPIVIEIRDSMVHDLDISTYTWSDN